jgi:hypothetical protein
LGCSYGRPKEIQGTQRWIQVLQSGVHGLKTTQGASITWISTNEKFQAVLAELNKMRFSEKPAPPLEVNFEQYCVLLFEMGRQSTAGYALALNETDSLIMNGKAVVSVIWQTPLQGAAVAQVLTNPFLLLKQKKIDLKEIIIVDQENQIIFTTSVPEECNAR